MNAEYKLNELNEPVITSYNNSLYFDMPKDLTYFRISANDNIIILSFEEMEEICEFFTCSIKNRNEKKQIKRCYDNMNITYK